MEWDGSLATGEATIDEQHRMIVGMVADLERAENEDGPDAVRAVLDRLTDYVAVHFAMEQDLMEREAYPAEATESHQQEHRNMTERVRDMVLEYRTGRLSSVAPLAGFLQEWISHHVFEVDRLLVDHVRARRDEQPY